uniref:Uncharacterized protein n=1 Tax=Anguilla anguilla TaxID=7936 RepID=A0A0E9XF49_ANGAN
MRNDADSALSFVCGTCRSLCGTTGVNVPTSTLGQKSMEMVSPGFHTVINKAVDKMGF